MNETQIEILTSVLFFAIVVYMWALVKKTEQDIKTLKKLSQELNDLIAKYRKEIGDVD